MYDQDGKEKRGKKKLKAQLLVEIKNSYGVPPPSLKKKKSWRSCAFRGSALTLHIR